MTALFAICAVVGGTIFIIQFVLGLLGLGGDHDVDADAAGDFHDAAGYHDATHGHHHDSTWLFGVLSFRAIVAAVLFFGLAGLASLDGGLGPAGAIAVAIGAALAAMLVVAAVMRMLFKLHADGTMRIQKAIGRPGTVYLTIPGNKAGLGKVTVDLPDRSVELAAVTFQDQLPTGSKIIVVDVIGADTVEVVAAPETQRISHA